MYGTVWYGKVWYGGVCIDIPLPVYECQTLMLLLDDINEDDMLQ
jgi:hypothetical protein